jgi:hypothetical protein
MPKTSSNQVIRFFLKLFLIIFIILIFDQGIGTVLKDFYFTQNSGPGYRTTNAVDSTLSDIIIFGSSRATHHYVPEIFENRMHYSYYNAGRDGNSVLYSYAIFKTITKRYNPKQIIVDISPRELGYFADEYARLSILLPYYKYHPEIRSIVNLRGPLEEFKLISAIYPFNSMIIQIVIGNLEYNKERDIEIKGYLPIYKTLKNATIDTLENSTIPLDENKILAIKDMISTCNQKKIHLIFVYSPIWQINLGSSYDTIFYQLCMENGIDYLDMSNHKTFIDNPDFFADQNHLNNEGARVFSEMLVEKIWPTK